MHKALGLVTGIAEQNPNQRLRHAARGSHPQQLHEDRISTVEEVAIAIFPSTELGDP